MKVLIAFLGLVSLGLAAPEGHNPKLLHPQIGGRIVGGDEANIRDLPYQVALLRNNAQICGGSIIAPTVILTAAHCVEFWVIPDVSMLSIRAGSSQWRSGGQQVAVREIVIHELYDGDNSLDYDIAILHLAERINTINASEVPLVNNGEIFDAGTYGTVSGWGTTFSGSSVSPETLRRVDVPIVTQTRCRISYGSDITSRMLCAGYNEGGKDACQGDSGGPYVINGRLAGVVSWGFGCATPLFPGVYASVAGLRTWITQHSGV
ncbi:trypsin beta [Dendroctonus ponderosae]